jgi:hypothetical protein
MCKLGGSRMPRLHRRVPPIGERRRLSEHPQLSPLSVQLGDRLRRLGLVTGKDTGGGAGPGTETPASTEVEAGEDVPEWARRDSNARPLAPEGHPPAQER